MNVFSKTSLVLAIGLFCIVTSAQANDSGDTKPADGVAPVQAAPAAARVGDPYPFGVCAVCEGKLNEKGEPVIKMYDGRDVRFCCAECSVKFEQNSAAGSAAIDKKILADQSKLYPTKKSIVSGKSLPDRPVEFVFGNRLIRVADEAEKTEFAKDAKKYMAQLDKAVVSSQGKKYSLKICPVSEKALAGNDEGEPIDYVVAGRLIRVCCSGCKRAVNKEPATYIAIVDEANKGEKAKPDGSHSNDGHDHNHDHGDHKH